MHPGGTNLYTTYIYYIYHHPPTNPNQQFYTIPSHNHQRSHNLKYHTPHRKMSNHHDEPPRATSPSNPPPTTYKPAWGDPPNPPPGLGTMLPIAITEWWTSRPPISRSLYQKAVTSNPTLTPLERLYLLSRLDLPGKALAQPESISEEDRNFLLLRPPRAVLAANIWRLFRTEVTTIPEVVDKFKDDLSSLSYAVVECISLNWWTMEQECAPAPWAEDWGGNTGDEGVDAAERLMQGLGPAETAFEDAAREIFTRADVDGMGGGVGEDEGEGEEVEMLSVEERAEGLVIEAGKLREVLCGEVKARLEKLSEEDRVELEALRERMVVEVEKDEEEDKKRKEEEKEERKRKAEEEVEEKRRKRARKAAGEGGDEEDDEEDSDEDGYVLGTLLPVFDE